MIFDALNWLWFRLRPSEGWLSFFLLLLVIFALNMAVLDVGWVPEDAVVIPATLLGLLLGVVLAKRSTPPWFAWLLITLYGLLIVVLTLARLWPPLDLLFTDWTALRQHWLENGQVYVERNLTWLNAVAAGGRSNETLIFAALMGLAAWFLSAYLGWSAYRHRQPLLGLTLLGLLIAFNGYYGRAPIEWAALFVGLAIFATAVFHFANLEWNWNKRMVDYSSQIRMELVLYAAGIGGVLLLIAFLLPAVRVRALASLLLGNESIVALEESLDRAFGGVEVRRERPVPPGLAGGAGILPRAFLLGNAPELQRIIMMTATAELVDGPPGVSPAWARHWRGLSYATYTGRGWTLDEEEQTYVLAGNPLPAPDLQSQMRLRQQVHWRYDNRLVRYSLGRPILADHPVRAYWLDGDLIRINGVDQNQYTLETLVSAAAAEELAAPAAAAIPPLLRHRYTQLPDSVPQRVFELAREVTRDLESPYAQALALERFLRQYPYSLEVDRPPAGVDVVDYFLFDLQQGYCDYYASAMVVMARSLGIPARLATGFLAQEPDSDGVQTIRQINAHAWAEVYIAGYGWIEFEPTASFVSVHDPQWAELADYVPLLPPSTASLEPIPEREPSPQSPHAAWIIAAAVLIAAGGGLLFWWRRRRRALRGVEAAYHNLQKGAHYLGQPLAAGQTPYEFDEQFQQYLDSYPAGSRLAFEAQQARRPAHELTTLFVEHQYSEHPPDLEKEANLLWQRLRRPMRMLRLGRFFGLKRSQS